MPETLITMIIRERRNIGATPHWNVGIMGSGKMGKCYSGEIHLDTKVGTLLDKRLPFKKQFR
jgi:hypothetical protein